MIPTGYLPLEVDKATRPYMYLTREGILIEYREFRQCLKPVEYEVGCWNSGQLHSEAGSLYGDMNYSSLKLDKPPPGVYQKALALLKETRY